LGKPWIFMGVDRSHFSAKLRPAVRYKQLHCLEYPPDLAEIQRRTGLGFVPVLITPEGEMLQDTTDIIDALEARVPQPPLMPPSAPDRIVCRIAELYADEFFPMVSMRTRWAYPENERELRRAFAAFSGSEAAGNSVADRMSSFLPVLGIDATTIPAIDAHTDDMLAALCRHFSHHRFLLGDRLSLADCALMGPLYAHLYLDRVTRRRLYDDAIEVCMWIERCNRPVPEAMGDWFAGAYPDTLHEVLELIGTDAAPAMLALENAFHVWAAEHARPGEPLPRGTGSYQITLRGASTSAAVRSYVPWKLQRIRDAYADLDAEARAAVADALRGSGCERLLARDTVAVRLAKRGYQLVAA
jgi:glutathione S-transferase